MSGSLEPSIILLGCCLYNNGPDLLRVRMPEINVLAGDLRVGVIVTEVGACIGKVKEGSNRADGEECRLLASADGGYNVVGDLTSRLDGLKLLLWICSLLR